MGKEILNAFSPAANLADSLFGKKPKMPDIPEPQAAAAPAPTRRESTGANVRIGTDAGTGGRRVGGTASKKVTTTNVLGGLGGGSGLNF